MKLQLFGVCESTRLDFLKNKSFCFFFFSNFKNDGGISFVISVLSSHRKKIIWNLPQEQNSRGGFKFNQFLHHRLSDYKIGHRNKRHSSSALRGHHSFAANFWKIRSFVHVTQVILILTASVKVVDYFPIKSAKRIFRSSSLVFFFFILFLGNKTSPKKKKKNNFCLKKKQMGKAKIKRFAEQIIYN